MLWERSTSAHQANQYIQRELLRSSSACFNGGVHSFFGFFTVAAKDGLPPLALALAWLLLEETSRKR